MVAMIFVSQGFVYPIIPKASQVLSIIEKPLYFNAETDRWWNLSASTRKLGWVYDFGGILRFAPPIHFSIKDRCK